MNQSILKKSAEFIVKRNVSERVARVIVGFDQHDGKLIVIYCLDGELLEDDRQDCELTCTELIAEFPEVKVAETMCVPNEKYPSIYKRTEEVVYSRQM